jgi:hypothetical protein
MSLLVERGVLGRRSFGRRNAGGRDCLMVHLDRIRDSGSDCSNVMVTA